MSPVEVARSALLACALGLAACAPRIPSTSPPTASHAPRFREGGFDDALAEARESHKLVVVDFSPRTEVADALLDAGETLIMDPTTPMVAWKRGLRFVQLHRARQDRGDAAGVARVETSWISFLRGEWARADAEDRSVLAEPLQFALVSTGDPCGALEVLAESVRGDATDAEALERYATALDETGRVDDAIATLAGGVAAIPAPRRLPVLWKLATLHRKTSDVGREIVVLDAAIALAQETPTAPHFAAVRTQIEARRAELGHPSQD